MSSVRPSEASLGRFVKRALDVTISIVGLLVASPVLAVAAAAIFWADRGPLFYRQERAGKDGHPFELVKLRSLRVNQLKVDEVGQVGSEHSLVTRPGRWIRRYKIDELPQLLNVLRGDMSVVGPRPTVPEQVVRYDSLQTRRLAVLPGITGWAQVNGNTKIAWDDRIALDIWYVNHWSVWLDLVILARTAGVVLWGERPNYNRIEQAKRHAVSSGRVGL